MSKIPKDLNDEDLWLLYGNSIQELKNRGLVRTSNITGERGEFVTVEKFNLSKKLPKLHFAPKSSKKVSQ